MGEKLNLDDINNGSVPSSEATINANNDKVEDAIDDTLSRTGVSPNQMEANLDLNNFKILNHAAPEDDTDLVRKGDLEDLVPEGPQGPQGPKGDSGDGSGDMLAANNLSDVDSVSASQTNLNLEPGVDVQEFSALLQDLVDFIPSGSFPSIVYLTASNTWDEYVLSNISINLLEAGSPSEARDDLGLGDSATLDVGTSAGTVAAGDDDRFSQLDITVDNTDRSFALNDAGTLQRHNSGLTHTWTIPAEAAVNFPLGSVIQIRNAVNAGNLTISRASGVALHIAGDTGNADVTLSNSAVATLIKEASDRWFITGVGIS